jgi:predicted TPR repeat methyltransferase
MDANAGKEAAALLRAHLGAGRGGALARMMLVDALLNIPADVPGALAEAREAASLFPTVAPVIAKLGEALLMAQHVPTAIAELQRALRLDPESREARHFLAIAWLSAGEAGKALEYADDESLRAEAEAIKAAPRSDPRYVRHLFDQFAADYDIRMREHLHYTAPEILLNLAEMVMPGRKGLSVLDLGCGTGLAGEAFHPLAVRLDGVDLSPAMIAKARARSIYDSLAVADLEIALAAPGPRHDLIIAADTLVYLGDLAPVFRAAAARLAPDGFFLFTVEKMDAGFEPGFELGPKRRWRHSEAYLRATADAAGLGVAGLVEAVPRREAQQAVAGLAVALTV